MSTEPTLACPNCGEEIKLTESLAAPMVAATRKELEGKMAQQRQALDMQLSEARATIAVEEAEKAHKAASADIDQKSTELKDLQAVLEQRDAKLAVAQKAQADAVRKERELDDAKREMQLTIDQAVSKGIVSARADAQVEAEQRMQLKVLEKEETIAAMQTKIEDLRRKAEQGSQQLQGEAQEIHLEKLLRAQFPHDEIVPVPKGVHGGDIVQRVRSTSGRDCGTILWESKNTKTWTQGWLTKLRDDQRAAKADIAVIVTQAMPKGVDAFDLVDGVWVAGVPVAAPIATMLRHSLLDVSAARAAAEGMQGKAEQVYAYLTGPQFKSRVGAVVEAFTTMADDLDKERKAITKQWAKREQQIHRLMTATTGMSGDLQGIAGDELDEIDGLSMKALSA